MEIPLISKRQFNRFKKFLPVPGNAEKILAIVVISCAIWVIKNCRSWRDIPVTYGKYNTIRKRFSRWSKDGKFRMAFRALVAKVGKKNTAALDSTIIKAHRTAASLKNDGSPREIGRSVGGLTTKIHLLANIEEKPLDFILSPGQASDAKEGEKLIARNLRRIKKLLADKAYDTDQIRAELKAAKKESCIPSKCNRKNPEPYDRELYKSRGVIENMFGRLKDWRGIAMRYCRSAHIFDSYVCIALITIFFDVP